MKRILWSFMALLGCSISYGQDKETEAQFSYAQAEEHYSKNQFPDAIGLCERAAEKLSATNQKILFLELKSYDGLLKRQCKNALLTDHHKIDHYISLYLDTLAKTADREKVFTIMKFKESWVKFKETGCVDKKPPPYASLGLGLVLKTYKVSFFENPGPFNHKKTVYNVPLVQKVEEGGLFSTKTSMKPDLRIFSVTLSPEPLTVDATPIKEDLRKVEGTAVGEVIERSLKTLINKYPDMAAVKIKFAGHYSEGRHPEAESETYEVTVRILPDQP